jgi:hypothetical protein
MSAFGFSAFVDGFFKGREIREGREDKKRQTERQERMDKILFDREARAAEMHDLDLKSKRQGLSAGELQIEAARRQRENEEEYRRIFAEGMADPEPEPLGAKPDAKSGTPEASAAVQGVAANLPRLEAPSRAADAFIRAVPLESLGAKVVGGAGSDSLSGGGGTDIMGQAPVSAPGGRGAPTRAATMAMQGMGDPSRMMYEEALRRQAQMQGPQRDPARVRGDVMPPPVDTTSVNPSYTENRPDRFAPDPQPPRVVAPPPPAGPDRRMQFEPLGVPRNDWQAPPRVEVQEAAMAAMAPPQAPPAPPAPQGPQLDRRAQFDPPVDPRRPLSELAAFSPQQIRQSAQRDPNAGPTFAERAYEATKPNYDHPFLQDLNIMADVAEAGKRVLHTGNAIASAVVGNQIETAKQSAGMTANTVNNLVNPYSGYLTGFRAPLVPDTPLGPGGILGPKAQAPAAAGPDAAPNAPPTAPQAPPTAPQAPPTAPQAPPAAPPNAPLGARQPPETPKQNPIAPPPGPRLGPTVESAKALQVQQAAQAVGPAAAVAVEEAQKVAKGPIGATEGDRLTPKQRDRAATSAMDRYTTTVVPRLIEEMLKRGDVDRAIKFQEFMQAAETKRAMKDYVHMVVAAGEQDIETFGKHFIAAYNRLGYYNDGTTIVADKSKFTTDENGAVNGAILTFRNEQTGDTYERVYDDPNQLYMIGLAAADPLNAFTETAARIKSANEAAIGARRDARTEAKAAEKDRQKNISDVAKLIFEQASKDMKPIPYEMALEEARRLYPPPEEAQQAAPPPLLRKN